MRKSRDLICEHCCDLIVGNAYRVTSEEAGITPLDIIVCSICFMEAKRLHLHAEEINVRSKKASARNQESHRPRLGISFGEWEKIPRL
jgi:RNase P subunit RPR2